MGQRTPGVNGLGPGPTRMEPVAPTEPKPEEIEREIDTLREELDDLVDELDRRRHEAFDWRLQLRRHAAPIAIGAGVLAVIALAATSRGRRRRVPLGKQLGALLRGAYAIGQHPERLGRVDERRPGLAGQLAKTAALAGASVVVRRLARRAVEEAW